MAHRQPLACFFVLLCIWMAGTSTAVQVHHMQPRHNVCPQKNPAPSQAPETQSLWEPEQAPTTTWEANTWAEAASSAAAPKSVTDEQKRDGNPLTNWIQPTATTQATQTTAQSASSSGSSGSGNSALDQHNYWRAMFGASDLVWDEELASGSKDYASTQCSGALTHAQSGENIYRGANGNMIDAINMWVDEVDQYDYNAAAFSDATGHFTQVVWKASTHVGCGSYTCGDDSKTVSVVCRYHPAGNVQGQFSANVGVELSWGVDI